MQRWQASLRTEELHSQGLTITSRKDENMSPEWHWFRKSGQTRLPPSLSIGHWFWAVQAKNYELRLLKQEELCVDHQPMISFFFDQGSKRGKHEFRRSEQQWFWRRNWPKKTFTNKLSIKAKVCNISKIHFPWSCTKIITMDHYYTSSHYPHVQVHVSWKSPRDTPTAKWNGNGFRSPGVLSIATEMVPRPRFSVYIGMVEDTCWPPWSTPGTGGAETILVAIESRKLFFYHRLLALS